MMKGIDNYDFRFRVLDRYPYTFVDVDEFFRLKDQGIENPYDIDDDACSVWQWTIPVLKSEILPIYAEEWVLFNAKTSLFARFAYSQQEKELLCDNGLYIKRKIFFEKNIDLEAKWQISLKKLYLPGDVYELMHKQAKEHKTLVYYECDGGTHDLHPYILF